MGFADNSVILNLGGNNIVGDGIIFTLGAGEDASVSPWYGCEKFAAIIKVTALSLASGDTLEIDFDSSIDGINYTNGGAVGKVTGINAIGNYLFAYAGAPISNLRVSQKPTASTDSATVSVDLEGTMT